MRLRRLTAKGLEEFQQYLDALTSNPSLPLPEALLDSEEFAAPVTGEHDVEVQTFGTRLEAASFLDSVFRRAGLKAVERDTGLWAWLTVLFFDQVCPLVSGQRTVRQQCRLMPDLSEYTRYYRHALAGSYLIYTAHQGDPQRVAALLAVPLHIMTDIIEQLASRQDVVTNSGLMAAASSLYFDFQRGCIKPNARGKGDGTARRLAAVVDQFDRTYDLYSMNREAILSLLPAEFDRFRENA